MGYEEELNSNNKELGNRPHKEDTNETTRKQYLPVKSPVKVRKWGGNGASGNKVD